MPDVARHQIHLRREGETAHGGDDRAADRPDPGLGDGFGIPRAHARGLTAVLGVVPKDLRPTRVPQLAQRGRLDLPDPLAGETHAATDLLEGARLVVDQAEAQLNHPALARAKRGEDVLDLVAEHGLAGRLERRDGLLVLNEVAQVRILFLADGRLEGYRLLRDFLQLLDLVDRDAHA